MKTLRAFKLLCINQFPGKRGAFAHVVSPGGGAFAILSRPPGLGISIVKHDDAKARKRKSVKDLWRAFLKRPENFSGPETVPQSSRNDFRVFLKAPEKF